LLFAVFFHVLLQLNPTLNRKINFSDRLLTWQIEMSVFLTFSKQKSLVSRMGDREEYLETPLPLPQSLCGRTDARTLTPSPNFLGFQVDGLPNFLTHGALLARFAH